MQYRKDKYGNPLSVLGFGCMRFTQSMGSINIKKAESEIMAAYRAGVNYFDTAYIYPGSEAALGEILEKNNIRDKVNIATKLPHYMLKKPGDADKYFDEELRRLRTDHVDYYLCHMLNDAATWERLKSIGLDKWIEEKKKSGQIRQIGFSYHGGSEAFCKLIDAYDWDFCMIQYNYLDEHSQAGKAGLVHANEKGLPVMIMEPLRGGRLVNNLPKSAVEAIEAHPVKRTAAQWSFHWLWNQPQVTCVLSGMNSLEMVEQNVKSADASRPGSFTEEDFALIEKLKAAINGTQKVGCTGCGYCMPCPKGVDIPGCFSAYNRYYYDSKFHGLKDYYMCAVLRKNTAVASNCVKCGRCEQHCPQGIKIREELENVAKKFEKPHLKLAGKVLKKFMKY